MLAVVTLPWIHKERANTSHEGALYAALDVISSGNPPLAQSIHDSNDPPPFSAHLADGVLRIGCLTTDVFLAVAQSPLAYKAVREYEDTFETLLAKAEGGRTIKLSFLSPTSFGLNGDSHLLADPRLVFGSLIRRWRQNGGAEIPDIGMEQAAVLNLSVRGRKVTLAKYVQYGFTGWVIYRVPAEFACYYHALAGFANYAGVGQRTSQGFGRVEYENRAKVTLPVARQDQAIPAAA